MEIKLECPWSHMVQTSLLCVCGKHLEKFGDAPCWRTGQCSNGANWHCDRDLIIVIGLRILIGIRLEGTPSVIYLGKHHTRKKTCTWTHASMHTLAYTYMHKSKYIITYVHTQHRNRHGDTDKYMWHLCSLRASEAESVWGRVHFREECFLKRLVT